MTLLAVPNFSEGEDAARIERLRLALGDEARLLDVHSDVDHDRTVFTLGGEDVHVGEALQSLAARCVEEIDMNAWEGLHPCVGALDVCPVVWPSEDARDRAERLAVWIAERIGDLGVPVFFYGELAADAERRERAHFRAGGLERLRERMASGELAPDVGPHEPHPTAGATLVTARAPLAAFNVELDVEDAAVAQRIAAELRESGGGLEGVRAIGLGLSTGRAQVSTNVHDPIATPLGEVVEVVRSLAAPLGARPVEAELIGLVPEAALAGYPEDVPIRGFDPAARLIERRLAG